MGFSTDAIHAGQVPDATTGAVMTPIYQTSTYVQDGLGKHKGFEYGRTQNFTRQALEQNIATLEKGKHGIAFSSGMSAINAVIGLVRQGDHVICTNNVYGGTFRFFDKIMKHYGVKFSFVDTSNTNNIKDAMTDRTRILFVETPTNPMLSLTDLKAAATVARAHQCLLVVDNTFMSPYFQNPLALGADVVLHSTTKYINGHSDVIGGVVITGNDDIAEKLRFFQNAVGGVPSPFDCWLVLRATKTLAVRMKQHNENAVRIAAFLDQHPKVKRTIYPGLESHPQHELARSQMRGFGGMISVDLGDMKAARRALESVRIFALAESLGGVESLISHPAIMTHASVPEEDREEIGISDGLIRLSVGIEDVEDLLTDLESALDKI